MYNPFGADIFKMYSRKQIPNKCIFVLRYRIKSDFCDVSTSYCRAIYGLMIYIKVKTLSKGITIVSTVYLTFYKCIHALMTSDHH